MYTYFKKTLLLILVLLFSISAISITNSTKTVSTIEDAVLLFYKDQDSLIKKEYKKIRKLYKENDLAGSLELALRFLDKINDNGEYSEYEYRVNFLLGDIFRKNNNHNKSIHYYKNGIKILNGLNTLLIDIQGDSVKDRSAYYIAKSNSYLKIGNRYLKLGEIDSTKFYFDKVLGVESLNDVVLSYKGSAMSTMSGIYMNDSLYDLAKEYANLAIDIHKKRNNKISEATAISNLANIYLVEGNYEKAKVTYLKALDLIKRQKSSRSLEVKERLYFNLAYNLYKLKDYTAYDYQEKSYTIKDSLRDKEIRTIIAEINGKFNVDVGKAIGRQEEENKRLLAERNTWILGISSFFIIVLLIFFLNQYKLRQKNLGLELSKQELMQQQRLEKIRSESQIRILNATLDGKETERKEIAETLHDSVSALLSSANLHLQACKKQFNGVTPIEVDKSQSIINEASQKIRDLSHTLVSSILLKFGLSYAIKDIAEKFSNSQLQIDYETKYIQRYDQGFEIKLYNITQEFVNNILKHSNATHAKIVLIEKNNKLNLTIHDNGIGFDKTTIPEKDGLGINQIEARIQMMQGEFHIESGNGNGTLITIELPVFKKEPVKYV